MNHIRCGRYTAGLCNKALLPRHLEREMEGEVKNNNK
jgi:hypothetical protein